MNAVEQSQTRSNAAAGAGRARNKRERRRIERLDDRYSRAVACHRDRWKFPKTVKGMAVLAKCLEIPVKSEEHRMTGGVDTPWRGVAPKDGRLRRSSATPQTAARREPSAMIKEDQALDRIRDALGHYLRREISHGEALEDVVTALEAAGRDPFATVERMRIGRESRSWAPRGPSPAPAIGPAEDEPLQPELTARF
jgi:hypothetical protein